MGADYQPGGSHFWVYFAAALPSMVLTFFVFILIKATKLDDFVSGLLNGQQADDGRAIEKVQV
jgi:hypothetical protein